MARPIGAASSYTPNPNGLISGPQARVSGLFLCLFHMFAPLVRALPVAQGSLHAFEEDLPKSPEDASLWAYLGTAIALVLLGGAFAGLTIALMGQDEIYLQVIATSGEGRERKNAATVLKLLKKGKHWVLVTLLLSNVITNETLPIVLDRSLGGGWPAVLASTVLIVIFGEIVPQSICVRYGLPIGAWCTPLVLTLMWIMAPVAYPTAKLLDYLLGEDHGTTYKKAGLKTLVTLHKTLGTSPDERLNEDEVTIITAVLDLKAKAVGSIMTPMKDVFTMSADTVLDEDMMNSILSAGYSRIPIHTPDNPKNFVGMLLVKMLITYDPEDALRVRDFALATLPETRPDTSCLDIINFFQEGKSHMVLVSDFPGESHGAVGVVTLEDVIEELIGEEIIDESDVFIDVHKAIRRMAPAPRTRVPRGEIVTDPTKPTEVPTKSSAEETEQNGSNERRKSSHAELLNDPKISTFLVRRRSSGHNAVPERGAHLALRSDDPEVIQHLKHLGPSNAANKPKTTRINTVKIKPGIPNTVPEGSQQSKDGAAAVEVHAPQGGVGEGLLESAGREASDGVHSLAVGYGTITPGVERSSWKSESRLKPSHDDMPTSPKSTVADENTKLIVDIQTPGASIQRTKSTSTIGSLHSFGSKPHSPPQKRHTARSGSISENIIDLNGVRKIVLETTSSSDSEDRLHGSQTDGTYDRPTSSETEQQKQEKQEEQKGGSKKKQRKKRGKKKKNGESSESQPLLDD
ncbi:DUF21-domain-containing protein [Aaosphaeria arxii CBS 175.79]|uniref:DUF21-domain-containing protein n=1 Tax=Aaosphaeria arxii CBS 175.79 TaxID=1450172 RepID=A0A6A5XA46_9PLEO|nr:DUF21-domain-containing protein [Aaosphaeria arxii CBS 175.79]KAF2009637.1 DUF21-domain-containing protein [Aaosphaeria arxii CBS 175.79]